MDLDIKKNSEKVSDETINVTESDNIENISTDDEECVKKYVCNYDGCNLAYFKQSRLDRHVRLHTGERPYKCDYPECVKAYTNSSHLKRHMGTHNDIAVKLQCNKCPLMLSNYHNLKRHYMRVHVNIITCNECNETFSKKHQLIHHMGVHFNDLSYKCDQCDKTFVNIKKFKRHEKYHNIEKKYYRCTVAQCTEVFDKWALLCKHKKTQHFNDFKCNQCEKVFSAERYLKRHSKIHAKFKFVIPCPYLNCERSYLYKSNLTAHINYFHLNKKFICDICKAKLSTKRKLILHIKNHDNKKKNKITEKSQKKIRKVRKDFGIPRRSLVTALTGLKYDQKLDKDLLKRNSSIKLIDI